MTCESVWALHSNIRHTNFVQNSLGDRGGGEVDTKDERC